MLFLSIFDFAQRYLSPDDRIAWGYHDLSEDLYTEEIVEEWIPLTGKHGDKKEGNINIILSLQVNVTSWYNCSVCCN